MCFSTLYFTVGLCAYFVIATNLTGKRVG